MAEKLVSAFEQYEYGCFLWVSGAIVRQFGHEEVRDDVRFAIWQFVERQCVTTFHLLEKNKINDIPDCNSILTKANLVIEDFFRLLMDALYCHPMDFTQSSLLTPIVQAALVSLALELENPLTAVLHFLRDFLGYAVGHAPSAMETEVPREMQTAIRGMISSNGAMLCRLIISGMIFTFPGDCVVDGAGALMTLIEMDPQTSVAWIANSVGMLPPENLSADERNKFITQIAKYDPGTLLTASAATGKDYRRIQRQIQDFVAIYRRRVISPRSKSQGKGFFDGVAFRFQG
jgi:transportin-3